MKKLLVALAVICLLSSFGIAQVWTYDSDFMEGPQPHGVVVDDNGLIWIGYYAYTDTMGLPGDTIPVAPIYVYNPDGTPAAFSPIYTMTGTWGTDTIATYCRGLSLDESGNVIFVGNQVLYKIDYTTGAAMDKYIYTYASGSLTSAAVDANGYVYLTKVVPGGDPLVILDSDLDEYNVVLDSCFTIQRSCLVSPDGKDFFLPIIYAAKEGVLHYYSADGPDGVYTAVDTILNNLAWGQCGDWDRQGLMWIGSYWNIDPDQWGGWYGLDTTQNFAIVDTIFHAVGARPDPGTIDHAGVPYISSPRHAAWSADGMTMYTADFDGGFVKKWTNASPLGPGDPEIIVGLYDKERDIIVVNFNLRQNYPNPFNPTTKIPFDIDKTMHVKLVVYDMLGRQVAVLVDDQLTPNSYEYEFDGSDLGSGTYYYQLIVDGKQVTKPMMLIK